MKNWMIVGPLGTAMVKAKSPRQAIDHALMHDQIRAIGGQRHVSRFKVYEIQEPWTFTISEGPPLVRQEPTDGEQA